jgi:hypothetical protein
MPQSLLSRVPLGRRLVKLAVVSLLLLGTVQPVLACVHPPPLPKVWIIFHSRTRVWIVVHGYRTSLVQPGQFCACGIPKLPCITSVNGTLITSAATGNPVAGFGFRQSSVTSQQFASLAPAIGPTSSTPTSPTSVEEATATTPWGGFLSPIGQTIQPDQEVDVMYDVNVVDGTTYPMLANALSQMGLFGNAEALSDGSLLQDHLAYVRPGEIGEGTKSMVTAESKKAMHEAAKKNH